MYAMLVRELGQPEVLEQHELPEPSPNVGEVVIDVRAIGCNFADILMVQGKYQVRPPLPFAPGSEVAGVVRSVGAGVDHVQPGDRVAAILEWGAYASVVVAPAQFVVRLPSLMSFETGAAFGVAYLTAYLGLVHRGGLRRGETLLVHAAASGVGLAAVEVGRALGARVLGTAGSEQKCAVAREHGAETCFDSSREDWVEAVLKATNGRGADVIYDPVGGDLFDRSLKCLAWCGRLLVIGFASGRIPTIEANRILLKNIAIVGLHLGAYRKHDPHTLRQSLQDLFGLYESGLLHPQIGATFPLVEAARALALLQSRGTTGKVVLIP